MKKKNETAATEIVATGKSVNVINAENFDFSALPTETFTLCIENARTKKNEHYTVSFTRTTLLINNNSVFDKTRLLLASRLAKRERLSNEDISRISDNNVVTVYKYYKKKYVNADKKKAFEVSGVKFMHEGKEYRFLPKIAREGNDSYLLFKAIDSNAICYLHNTKIAGREDSFEYGVLAKQGKNAGVKETLVGFTRSFLLKLMNDAFNGMVWSDILAACEQVKNFGTCNVPKQLK